VQARLPVIFIVMRSAMISNIDPKSQKRRRVAHAAWAAIAIIVSLFMIFTKQRGDPPIRSPGLDYLGSGALRYLGSSMAGHQGPAYDEQNRRCTQTVANWPQNCTHRYGCSCSDRNIPGSHDRLAAQVVSISRCASVGSDACRVAGSRSELCRHAIALTVVSSRERGACVWVGTAIGFADCGASSAKSFFGYQGTIDRRRAAGASIAYRSSPFYVTQSEVVLYTLRTYNKHMEGIDYKRRFACLHAAPHVKRYAKKIYLSYFS